MQKDGNYPVFTINFDQLSPMCDGDLSSQPSSDSDSQSGSGSRPDSDNDPSATLVVSRVPVGIVPRHIEGKGTRLPKAILQTPVASNSSEGPQDVNEHRPSTTHASRHFEELLQRLNLEEKQRLPFKPVVAPFKFKQDRSMLPVHLRTKEVLRKRAEEISKIQADIVHHEQLQQWKMLDASRKMTDKADGARLMRIYTLTTRFFWAGGESIHCHISKIL